MGGTTLHADIVAQWFEISASVTFFEDMLLWVDNGI